MIPPDDIGSCHAPGPASAIIGVELDSEAVLYHEDLNTVHLLNPTATIIWNSLDGETDLASLTAYLADAFSADLDVVMADVIAVVREFGRQGLLLGVEPDQEAIAEHELRPDGLSEVADDRF